MSYAYPSTDVTPTPVVTVGASKTNTVVSRVFKVSHAGSLNLVVRLKTSATTVATGITAKLQTVTDIAGTWVDSKTVSITGDGDFYIKLNVQASGDQTYLPLLTQGRLVVSSGSGDSTTISLVEVVQGV